MSSVFRAVIGVFLLSLFAACSNKGERAGNHLFEGWYADPEGVVFDDKYWIYPTFSGSPAKFRV